MTYYQIDDTGELLSGPIDAREDPRTPGHFFIPNGGIIITPPEISSGHVARWKGDAWEIFEDHRGLEGWVEGEPTVITELGPLPEGWIADAPTPQEPLEPDSRTLAREALAEQWATLPAWIRGPFAHRFSETIRLLDAGEDDAAVALIQYVTTPPTFSPEQVGVFEVIQCELLAAVLALPRAAP